MTRTAKLLRDYRTIRGLTMIEVAKPLGFTAQFYNNIEHDRAPIPKKYIKRIQKKLLIPKSLLKESLLMDFNEEMNKWI